MKWNVVSELDVVLFLAICLLVPFVSGQSFKRRSNGRSLFLARPGHMLCVDPWRSKWPLVLCCQAIIIYHVLIWLSFLLLTIQGNLQLLPFILLKIDPTRNISSISRHSPCNVQEALLLPDWQHLSCRALIRAVRPRYENEITTYVSMVRLDLTNVNKHDQIVGMILGVLRVNWRFSGWLPTRWRAIWQRTHGDCHWEVQSGRGGRAGLGICHEIWWNLIVPLKKPNKKKGGNCQMKNQKLLQKTPEVGDLLELYCKACEEGNVTRQDWPEAHFILYLLPCCLMDSWMVYVFGVSGIRVSSIKFWRVTTDEFAT